MKKILFIFILLPFLISSVFSYNIICPEGYSIETNSDGSKNCVSPPEYHKPFSEKYLDIQCPEGTIRKDKGSGSICESIPKQQTGISVSYLDVAEVYVGNIQTDLQSRMSAPSIGTSVSTTHKKTENERECIEEKGCWIEGMCYSLGYRLNGQYCSEKGKFISTNFYRSAFVNQTKIGNPCEENFECKSGLCQNELCVNIEEEIDKQVNQRLNEIRDNIVSDIEEGINQLNDTEKYYVEVDNHQVAVDKPMLQRLFSWLRGVLK